MTYNGTHCWVFDAEGNLCPPGPDHASDLTPIEEEFLRQALFIIDGNAWVKTLGFVAILQRYTEREEESRKWTDFLIRGLGPKEDADGHCNICGLPWEDPKETQEQHVCPPGFMQGRKKKTK